MAGNLAATHALAKGRRGNGEGSRRLVDGQQMVILLTSECFFHRRSHNFTPSLLQQIEVKHHLG
ncbi:MAG: hypothetical protein ABSF35_15750 [Polyangia bacterium]